MVSEVEKRGKSWFKSVMSNQAQPEKNVDRQQSEESSLVTLSDSSQNFETQHSDSGKPLFPKDNYDKIALEAIISIETILKDRQLLSYKSKGLEEQLAAANETINRLKQEQIKKENILLEKNKEIRELENNLTHKQMSYDQLLEDYKEYQLTSKMEYEKLSNQFDTEVAKYNKLYDESSNTQYQNMLKINTLEDKVRGMEIETQKYAEQYQKIVNEKTELLKTINDFTEKMSFTFSTKAITSDQSQTE